MVKKKISILLAVTLSTSMALSSTMAFAADTYTVKTGDTLVKIGQEFSMDWNRLAQINNIKNPNVISAGEILRLNENYIQKDLNEQDVMSLMWMQTSAEYKELCYQAYNLGKIQVDEAVKNAKQGDKPLAIIVDCDETVIDNSAYDAGFTDHNDAYAGTTWAKWVDAAEAKTMPGSKEFLNYVASKGVDVFYVTNRDAKAGFAGTMKNLKDLGYPNVDEKHLLLQTDTGNKQPRYDAVAKDYTVVVYMGDNAGDLPINTYHKNMQDRNSIVDKNEDLFGAKFIALPNPVYGDFESSIVPNYFGLTAQQKNDARKVLLRTWRADGVNSINTGTYTVLAGDTLSKIGQKLSLDWKTLAQINNIKNPNVIYTGDVLRLTSGYIQKDLNEQVVMALLWMQTSAEYRELCYQAYNAAKMHVDEALKNAKQGDKPLAIIADCDETLLDNSAYDAGFTDHNDAYAGDTWAKWVNASEAKAMPGSKEFLSYLQSKGVEVFYVTNRDAKAGLTGTMKNLKDLGYPNVDEKHVLLQTDSGNKQARFDAVAKDYNVAVYMGDNAGDLPLGTYHKNMVDRNNIVDNNINNFGTKFIALPNPVYGDWESSIVPNYFGLTAQQKDAARKAQLRTWRADQ